jgi:hypothetical protein
MARSYSRASGSRVRRTLRAVSLTVLLLTPLVSVTIAAPATSSRLPHRSQPASFSDLAELTPTNVQRLLPLVSRGIAARFDDQGTPLQQRSIAHGLQGDSQAGVDLRLQKFLEERVHLQLACEEPAHLPPRAGASGSEISYVIDTPAPVVESAAAAPGERALLAWNPIERRVVWSVTEALPISARTLVTAGGLVFYGTTDGWFKALDARTGRTLWKYQVEGRQLAEPFSYRGADGHQYIGVHSRSNATGGGRATQLIFALAH